MKRILIVSLLIVFNLFAGKENLKIIETINFEIIEKITKKQIAEVKDSLGRTDFDGFEFGIIEIDDQIFEALIYKNNKTFFALGKPLDLR